MPEQARVNSLEALESFRTALVLYLEKAARAVEELDEEVTRTRLWLEHDRRPHWEAQVRRLTTELDLRQQELFSARLSSLAADTLMEQKAVQQTQRALDAAAAKLQLVKQHNRQYENRVAPMAKEIEKARAFLIGEMRHALAELAQTITTLHAYAGVKPLATPAPGGQP